MATVAALFSVMQGNQNLTQKIYFNKIILPLTFAIFVQLFCSFQWAMKCLCSTIIFSSKQKFFVNLVLNFQQQKPWALSSDTADVKLVRDACYQLSSTIDSGVCPSVSVSVSQFSVGPCISVPVQKNKELSVSVADEPGMSVKN